MLLLLDCVWDGDDDEFIILLLFIALSLFCWLLELERIEGPRSRDDRDEGRSALLLLLAFFEKPVLARRRLLPSWVAFDTIFERGWDCCCDLDDADVGVLLPEELSTVIILH